MVHIWYKKDVLKKIVHKNIKSVLNMQKDSWNIIKKIYHSNFRSNEAYTQKKNWQSKSLCCTYDFSKIQIKI
jgi:hypothetical protein